LARTVRTGSMAMARRVSSSSTWTALSLTSRAS
jgi:hypothetical protein